MIARLRGSRGQASVELVAAAPFVLIAAVLCLQLLAAGYSLTLADGAVEAGALAAGDRPAAADGGRGRASRAGPATGSSSRARAGG